MKKSFIVANWKSNKTSAEAKVWLEELRVSEGNTIILCPAFTLLSDSKSYIIDHNLPVKLGSQDISPFEAGAYTGEVNGLQIKDYAEYVLIGHSERRTHFTETDDLVREKSKRALEAGLVPILCVQDVSVVPEGVKIVAYEPVFAIGTGNPDTPENADKVAREIKEKNSHVKQVLYGGSVTSGNIKSFVEMESINGVLVGKASLDAQEFSLIVNNVS